MSSPKQQPPGVCPSLSPTNLRYVARRAIRKQDAVPLQSVPATPINVPFIPFKVGEMADDQRAAGRPFRPHRPDAAEPFSVPQRGFNVGHADVEQNAARIAGAAAYV